MYWLRWYSDCCGTCTVAERRDEPWPYTRVSCLEWAGLTDDDGYGRVKIGGSDTRAHRAIFELWYGVSLSAEQVILHACDNPKCFNPYHLSVGTQRDNVRDMDAKGRRVSGNALKTTCPHGHEYTPENTVVYKDGKRRCKACRDKVKGAKSEEVI